MGGAGHDRDAGIAFPDWPLSNGSINPEGWLRVWPMFLEHSHGSSALRDGHYGPDLHGGGMGGQGKQALCGVWPSRRLRQSFSRA